VCDGTSVVNMEVAAASTWMGGATVLAATKVQCSPSSPASLRCAWLRVAARFPSPPLRAAARREPGRGGKASAPIAPEAARFARLETKAVQRPHSCLRSVSAIRMFRPRSPAIREQSWAPTQRHITAALKWCLRVAQRISRTSFSAGTRMGGTENFWLIFTLLGLR